MSDIKFKFSKDSQRELNVGQQVDPAEDNKRKIGRHLDNIWVNLNMRQIREMTFPTGFQITIFELKDDYGNLIPPSDPRYWTQIPIEINITCSEINPDPLARMNNYDLQNFITEYFGKYIVNKPTKKPNPATNDLRYFHKGMMQGVEDTRLGDVNKRMFNVVAKEVNEVELDIVNERYNILGYKLRKQDALMQTQKTINTPRKLIFELGDY